MREVLDKYTCMNEKCEIKCICSWYIGNCADGYPIVGKYSDGECKYYKPRIIKSREDDWELITMGEYERHKDDTDNYRIIHCSDDAGGYPFKKVRR